MSNQINIIHPYLQNGFWVFDDASKGLDKEPFVGGIDTMIEIATSQLGIQSPEKGFSILFSEEAFPGYDLVLEWVRPELSGNVYRWVGTDKEGWLCPALLKFFSTAPKTIYIKLQSRKV